jgi:hypothetical protein
MVNGKLTLIGTDNDGFRHRYSCTKNESFKKIFIRLMAALDFEEEKIKNTFWSHDEDERPIELKISEFEDVCNHYQNKKYDVDIFYGKKKIIIVIRTKNRKDLVFSLRKLSKFVKPSIFKKLKEKSKKKVVSIIRRRK